MMRPCPRGAQVGTYDAAYPNAPRVRATPEQGGRVNLPLRTSRFFHAWLDLGSRPCATHGGYSIDGEARGGARVGSRYSSTRSSQLGTPILLANSSERSP